jgi:uncharacterized protein with HEPN domain
MYDPSLLIERLETTLEALERIPARFAPIGSPADFTRSEEGREKLDAICMMLLAVGEEFKQIDRKTGGKLLERYPEVDWRGVKSVRDVIAHGYFTIDVEEVFGICQTDIPVLINTVRKMIADLR